jgi:hypothetical protein
VFLDVKASSYYRVIATHIIFRFKELFLRHKNFLKYLGFNLLIWVEGNIPYKYNLVLEYNLKLISIYVRFYGISYMLFLIKITF